MFQIMRRKKYGQYSTGFLIGNNEKQKALYIGRRILELLKQVKDFEPGYKLDMRTLRFIVSDRPVKDPDGVEGRSILVGYKVTSYEKELAVRSKWRKMGRETAAKAETGPGAGKAAGTGKAGEAKTARMEASANPGTEKT